MDRKTLRNYYELLDVGPRASAIEMDEAYRRAVSAYGEGSTAAYSLYSDEEKAMMIGEITEAYDTLKDPMKRKAYDKWTAGLIDEGTSEIGGDFLPNGAGPGCAVREPEYGSTARLTARLAALNGADPMAAEQYRVLCARLDEAGSKNSYKTFVVTSAVKGEGKSTTSLNLSSVMAGEFGKKTLFIEGDLRKGSTLSGMLDRGEGPGLADVLSGEVAARSAIRRIEGTGLYVLASGVNTKKTPELLGSSRLKALLDDLRDEYDFIIMDAPPILPLADMDIISRQVDAILVVVMAGRTPKSIVLKAVGSLKSGNVAGIILNRGEVSFKKYYY